MREKPKLSNLIGFGLIITAVLSISCSGSLKGSIYNLIQIKIADTEIIEDFENDPAVVAEIEKIRGYGFYFVSNISPGFLWALVSDEENTMLEKEGFKITKIMKGEETDLFKRMVWGNDMELPEVYHTYDEVVQELKDIHDHYTDITSLHVIGSSQQSKRKIYALKLSGNSKNKDSIPKVLFSAAIHGNEVMGTEICLKLLKLLCSK